MLDVRRIRQSDNQSGAMVGKDKGELALECRNYSHVTPRQSVVELVIGWSEALKVQNVAGAIAA
jgi:hypothetical protein